MTTSALPTLLPPATAEIGLARRVSRLFGQDGRTLTVGFDHAVSVGTVGNRLSPLPLLAQLSLDGGADALQMGLNAARWVGPVLTSAPGRGLVLRIDQSDVDDTAAQSVGASVAWGTPAQVAAASGDAVVVFYVHDERDGSVGRRHAAVVGAAAGQCQALGLPLMVEVLVKSAETSAARLSAAAIDAGRIAYELGADIVKIDQTPDPAAMKELVEAVPVPVLQRGGRPRDTLRETLADLDASMRAGAAGAVFGRTVWQHENPQDVTSQLAAVVHGR
ncbi:class I fructose-bisphosphate aldolase [Oerskovia turbata]